MKEKTLVEAGQCPMVTFHLDNRQLTLHGSFFLGGEGGEAKAKSSQVPYMFPQRVPNTA
jgi:hypothetical protein